MVGTQTMNRAAEHRAITTVLVALALSLLLSCVSTGEPPQPGAMAEVVMIDGDVEVRRAGAATYLPAKVGNQLLRGDRIKTGDSGHARLRCHESGEELDVREMSIIDMNDFHCAPSKENED